MKYFSVFSGIGGFELGIQQAYETIKWSAKNVGNKESFTKEKHLASSASLTMPENGDTNIQSDATSGQERKQESAEKPYSMPMAIDAPAAEKQQKSFCLSTIKTMTDSKTGTSTEPGSNINLPSEETSQTPINSFATIATTQKQDTESAPICVGFSEIDKYAVQIYQSHFDHTNYGDITRIVPEELPDFDLICGGFPCQAFSIAGKRGGFNDTRGTLFFEVARIAKAKQPMYVLLENVKGLVSHDGGRTLETILATLQELGYYVNYEIRNSKDYGVPQNRERIFLLCKHIKILLGVGLEQTMTNSERTIEEWLFQVLLNNLTEAKKLQGQESKDWVLGYLLCREISQNQELGGENILDGILTATGEGSYLFRGDPWQNIDMWLNKGLVGDCSELNKSTILTAISEIIEAKTYTYSLMFRAILLATVLLRQSSSRLWNEVLSNLILIQENTKYARINNKSEEVVISENGVAHISQELQDPTKYFALGHLRGTPRPKVFPFGENSEPDIVLPTLTARYWGGQANGSYLRQVSPSGGSQGERVYDPSGIATTVAEDGLRIRRLTPTECERLQGFPDGWTDKGLSDIMEVCVNITDAAERRLQRSDIVCSTTKDGSVTELLNCPSGSKKSVDIVIDEPLPASCVTDIINRGNATVTLYSQPETSSKEEVIKQSDIFDATAFPSTSQLWNVRLAGEYSRERLSTILTSIRRITTHLTSISVGTEQNTIGVITQWNSQPQNFLGGTLYRLRMANIESISDTQRYKTLGNAVTVNVIEAIAERLL